MKASNGRKYENKDLRTVKRKTNGQILPALIAVGGACGLAAAPASAIELGEISIDSTLGQPLRASIAYALNSNEQLSDFCIFLKRGTTSNGIPSVSNARITIADGAIILNGRTPILEPLLALQLSVNCPHTANLARDYTLMINPSSSADSERAPLSQEEAPLAPVQISTVTASDVVSEQESRPGVPTTRVRPQDETPIAKNSRYLVQTGDSLSQIASRIENRSIALWPAVAEIFAANPDAFLNNDPDLLKAGSLLVIPDMTGINATATATDTSTVSQTTVSPDAQSSTSYPGATVAATTTLPEPAEAAEPAPAPEPELAPVEEAAATEMQPGDIIIGTDSPFVVPVGDNEIIDIPDTALDAPQVSRPVPAITSSDTNDSAIGGAWSWLLWLGGAGLALIIGLLMFGRQIRERFGSVAVGAPSDLSRRREDMSARQPAVEADTDYELNDDTLKSQSITLDADLHAGSGLQEASEAELTPDFGLSASGATITQVDVEISEQASREEKLQATDILPLTVPKVETILEDEIMPSDDDATVDYDLSMMVDATKHIVEDDAVTAKDLMAVAVQLGDDKDDNTGEYTLNKEVDFQVLERDYEDELSATQILNNELEEAARALVEGMDDLDVGDETAQMPSSENPEMTAELASGDAQNDDFSDSVEIPALTDEPSPADTGATIEMESGSIDTKKSKKAS